MTELSSDFQLFAIAMTSALQKVEKSEMAKHFWESLAILPTKSYDIFKKSVIASKDSWVDCIPKIIEPLYNLYQYHQDNLRIDPEYKSIPADFWYFVKSSSELMNLDFFYDLYSTANTLSKVQRAFDKTKPSELLAEFQNENITPNILCNATSEELKWRLDQNSRMSEGAKLHLLWIHRHYCT